MAHLLVDANLALVQQPRARQLVEPAQAIDLRTEDDVGSAPAAGVPHQAAPERRGHDMATGLRREPDARQLDGVIGGELWDEPEPLGLRKPHRRAERRLDVEGEPTHHLLRADGDEYASAGKVDAIDAVARRRLVAVCEIDQLGRVASLPDAGKGAHAR
jgi:hypothetical protein